MKKKDKRRIRGYKDSPIPTSSMDKEDFPFSSLSSCTDRRTNRIVLSNTQIHVPKYEFPISSQRSLAEIRSEGWEIFTPALLYLYGGFNDQMLLDFLVNYGKEVKFYYKKFSQPLFEGFDLCGDRDWNHALWFLDKDNWQYFVTFVTSLFISSQADRSLWHFQPETVFIIDPLASSSSSDSSTLITEVKKEIVFSFQFFGNRYRLYFHQEDENNPLPYLVMGPPLPEDVQRAELLFSKSKLFEDHQQ